MAQRPPPSVGYMPDQQSSKGSSALTYTANPWALLFSDIGLFFSLVGYVPYILYPFHGTRPLDELSPSLKNYYNVVFQFFSIILQLLFIFSLVGLLVLGPIVPLAYAVLYVGGVIVANHYVCKLINGNALHFESDADLLADRPAHPKERWIFLNGIAVGHHWLRQNINNLSLVFGRRILGVHNPTAGLIFDLVQCLIQREFGLATQDVRDAYVQVKDALYDPQYTKVVFIVHSQGAIEGGLILDWLLDEVPQDLLKQLEVYTFGNAANHFNNPATSSLETTPGASRSTPMRLWDRLPGTSGRRASNGKVIGHIEHYANSKDFVAQWGVLHFTESAPRSPTPPPPPPSSLPASTQAKAKKVASTNAFMGRVFVRPGTGHLLNQHYLDTMFTLDNKGFVEEHNAFMDMELRPCLHGTAINGAAAANGNKVDGDTQSRMNGDTMRIEPVWPSTGGQDGEGRTAEFVDVGSPVDRVLADAALAEGCDVRQLKVRDLSRLWLYRNGGSPRDC